MLGVDELPAGWSRFCPDGARVAHSDLTRTLHSGPDLARDPSPVASLSALQGLSRELTKFAESPDRALFMRRRRWARRTRAKGIARWVGPSASPAVGRIARCGEAVGSEVVIKSVGGRCFPVGVRSCGSVWSCPVCSTAIRTRREVELNLGAQRWVDRGGSLAMVTLTLRHSAEMSLGSSLNGLLGSFRVMGGRGAWRRLRKLCGGVVRALEVTTGPNGWHPHLHALLFVRPGVDRAAIEAAADGVVTEWRSLVSERVGLTPSVERGVVVTWFGGDAGVAAKYVTKVAKELTQSDSKSGRDPFSLLDAPRGDSVAVASWLEYVEAMAGRQSIAWSKGLRDVLQLGDEVPDELVADEWVADDGEVVELVAVVARNRWNELVRDGQAFEYLRRLEVRLEVSGQRWRRE